MRKNILTLAAFVFVALFTGVVFNTTSEAATPTGTAPIYRFWSGQTHFYTQSVEDRDLLTNNAQFAHWSYEGAQLVAGEYNTTTEECEAGTPVYRFWSPTMQTHFYAESEEIKNYVEATWADAWDYEQIAFCAELEEVAGTTPVYRFWSESLGKHFYTISETDMQTIRDNWADVWTYESTVFYAYEFDKTSQFNFINDMNVEAFKYIDNIVTWYITYETDLTDFFSLTDVPDLDTTLAIYDELVQYTNEFQAGLASISTVGQHPAVIAYQEAIDDYFTDLSDILENEFRDMLIIMHDMFVTGNDRTAEYLDLAQDIETKIQGSLDAFEDASYAFLYDSGLSETEISEYVEANLQEIVKDADAEQVIFILEQFLGVDLI